jgi:rifampin ADP-ribosylating transferase
MEAEFSADIPRAKELFLKAWETAQTDFEKFTAAHYAARNQADPNVSLYWNLLSLQHANLVDNDETKGYFSSLNLNIGKSFEDLGNRESAASQYALAEQNCRYLPAGRLAA